MPTSLDLQRSLIHTAQYLEETAVDSPGMRSTLLEGAQSCRQAKAYIEQQAVVATESELLQRLREVLKDGIATEQDLPEIQKVADLKRKPKIVYSSRDVIDD